MDQPRILKSWFVQTIFANIPYNICDHLTKFYVYYEGPFRTSDKVVYLDKFSDINNILQVRMVCHDLTNFGRSCKNGKNTDQSD